MNTPLIVVIVIVVVLVDVAVFAFVIRRFKRKHQEPSEHYLWLAQQLDMAITGGDPMLPKIKFLNFLKKPYRVEGVVKGCALQIYEYTVSSNNSSTTYTTCRVETPNPRALTFHFAREGALAKVGKMLGLRDI